MWMTAAATRRWMRVGHCVRPWRCWRAGSVTRSRRPRNALAAWAVVDKFKAEGYDPKGNTLYTYATIQAFAQAAEKAKSVNVNDLSKALHSMTAHTVVGLLSWDKKGDVTNSKYVFYVWKNGTYIEM